MYIIVRASVWILPFPAYSVCVFCLHVYSVITCMYEISVELYVCTLYACLCSLVHVANAKWCISVYGG